MGSRKTIKTFKLKPDELSHRAMKRCLSLWNREMPDRILVSFGRHFSPAVEADTRAVIEATSEDTPPTYNDLPRMLQKFESSMDVPMVADFYSLDDDYDGIHGFMPDLQFGCGMMGAIFDAPVIACSTSNHTITYNTPIVTNPDRIDSLVCNPLNEFISQILEGLRYFVRNAKKPFGLQLLHALEGGDFLVAMRGETQALYDLADGLPFVEKLFKLGFESASILFALRRDIVCEHNLRVYDDREYIFTAPQMLKPTLDTDTDVMCSAMIFEKYGLRYKQEILNRFDGGSLYIHTKGLHLVPSAGRLDNLTQLRFCDDPNQPRAFDRRLEIRRTTYDIPLHFGCDFGEFTDALKDRTLPGGSFYGVGLPSDISVEDVKRVLARVREYSAGSLTAKPCNKT